MYPLRPLSSSISIGVWSVNGFLLVGYAPSISCPSTIATLCECFRLGSFLGIANEFAVQCSAMDPVSGQTL